MRECPTVAWPGQQQGDLVSWEQAHKAVLQRRPCWHPVSQPSAEAACLLVAQVSHTIFHVAPSAAVAAAPLPPASPAGGLSAAMRSRWIWV